MKLTQEAAILAHLKTGASISSLEALNQYGCFRLASVIFNLRKAGYAIKSTQGRHAEKRFAVYRLEEPVIPVEAVNPPIAPQPESKPANDLFEEDYHGRLEK